MTDDERQDRVFVLADGINRMLAGFSVAEAHTALTLAIMSAIVASCDRTAYQTAADELHRQVSKHLNRPDMVEWIKAGIHPAPTTKTQ